MSKQLSEKEREGEGGDIQREGEERRKREGRAERLVYQVLY